MNLKKIICFTIGIVLVWGVCFSGVMAAEFRVATKERGNISIDKDEKVKNLYAAGNMISIDGDVEKSLYIGGNIITVNGNVEGNLCAGGGTIVIRGNVGDSVHVGGGNILIESKIEEDLFIGGGNITISKTASIGGDLIIGGGTIEINGPIAGDILLGGGQVIINSKIGGQVKAKVDKLELGDQAEIVGDLKYTSPREVKISEEAVILGEIDFEKKEVKKFGVAKRAGTLFGILTLMFLFKILAGIIVGLILVYLFRNMTEKVVRDSLTRFWKSLSFGFSALVLTPITAIIIAITLVGLWLAGLIFAAYILMVVLSMSLAGVAFGSWLIKIIRKQSQYPVNWQAVIVGVIGLSIVFLIPFIGWLVKLIFMLIALGALYRMVYQNLILRK